jgi:dihydrofolate reductase
MEMPKVRVHNFTISLDGYAAGPEQSPEDPIGVGGRRLHEWIYATRTFRQMVGQEGGETGVDDGLIAHGDDGIGATIMGRNMFGPVRGPWDGETWRGWWGEEPPFHHPVFVLTHHPRASVRMLGNTIFHFVTEGIETALERALKAADGGGVRIGGGAATIQQYLRAGLIDELHLAVVPMLLGRGERLFEHLEGAAGGYQSVELVASPSVMHVRLARTAGDPGPNLPNTTRSADPASDQARASAP